MSRRREDLNLQEAAHCADEIVTRFGFATLPIDPHALAEANDIVVAPRALEGCSGCLMKQGDNFGILYSDKLKNDGFERFTVSHELGHFFLPGHPEFLFSGGAITHQSSSGFVSKDLHERQADHFAASLLMPEKLFVAAARAERAHGFEKIEKLAKLCRTSITAAALRYAKFADDPVVVIMSRGQTVEWWEMSAPVFDLPNLTWINRGSSLPRESATARFNKTSTNIAAGNREEATSILSNWLDGAPDVEMNEDVVGLGSYGRTLTVLFTDEALDAGETDDDD